MHSKLTLRLQSSTIKKAKAWAKRWRISLSQVMEMFFDHIPDANHKKQAMGPWMKQLLHLSEHSGKAPTDVQVRKQYHAYLKRKYQ